MRCPVCKVPICLTADSATRTAEIAYSWRILVFHAEDGYLPVDAEVTAMFIVRLLFKNGWLKVMVHTYCAFPVLQPTQPEVTGSKGNIRVLPGPKKPAA